ncbi:MAG: 30S ribosomal protein S20 [Oscillospiraceae bacterium]|nr:30S ribosomal protein S20 [Oscillospiraceae bacterium]
MANIKSQKKRVLTNAKATARNKAVRTNLKTSIKKANAALSDGTADRDKVVADTYSVIDKAAKKGIIHKKTAARKKASIAKKSVI